MKIIYSCLIIMIFFTSCTNDENTEQSLSTTSHHKIGTEIMPTNIANHYDIAGVVYDQLFDEYYNGSSRSADIQSVISDVEAIADADTLFAGIKVGHQAISFERVQYLASISNDSIGSFTYSTSLTSIAKASFSDFLIAMANLFDTEENAEVIYNEIVKFEASIITNPLLTTNDKRLILTTTSIMRYNSHRAKKKPKKNTDPYIDIWVTHVFGAADGAEENIEKAILQSLVTFIVSNK